MDQTIQKKSLFERIMIGISSIIALVFIFIIIACVGLFYFDHRDFPHQVPSAPGHNATPAPAQTNPRFRADASYVNAHVAAKMWLEANLRDPDSLQMIDDKVMMEDTTGMLLVVRFRAKNGFGGYDVGQKLFLVKGEDVVKVTDLGQ